MLIKAFILIVFIAAPFVPAFAQNAALSPTSTDTEIKTLVADLQNGPASRSSAALLKLGTRALPALFDYLVAHSHDGEDILDPATKIIGLIGVHDNVIPTQWQNIAVNINESKVRRLAALSGLKAFAEQASFTGPAIAVLLNQDNKDDDIRKAAQETLTAMRDVSALKGLADQCQPVESDPEQSIDGGCMIEIAQFGKRAEPVGDKVLIHLHSSAPYLRIYAAVALGDINYQPAIPDLIDALSSNDWRLVMASARSLGWLDAKQARRALEHTAQTHWLDVVRNTATIALQSINADHPTSLPVTHWHPFGVDNPFDFDRAPFGASYVECPGGKWRWSDGEFTFPRDQQFQKDSALKVANGMLQGINHGEYGGSLNYIDKTGKQSRVLDSNIMGIEDGPDGIVAVTGMAHMTFNFGEALSVKRDPVQGYTTENKLPLPGAPRSLSKLNADELMLYTTSGVYIMRKGWSMEQAKCDAAK